MYFRWISQYFLIKLNNKKKKIKTDSEQTKN